MQPQQAVVLPGLQAELTQLRHEARAETVELPRAQKEPLQPLLLELPLQMQEPRVQGQREKAERPPTPAVPRQPAASVMQQETPPAETSISPPKLARRSQTAPIPQAR